MSQSALIGGALLAGFALFVTARNRLPVYGAILWGTPTGHAPEPVSPTAGVIPGTGGFDPMDILGDYGIGVGDLLKHLPGIQSVPDIPDMGAHGF